MNNLCFNCGGKGDTLFGYTICSECEKKLNLLTDDTIQKHIELYKSSTSKAKRSYEDEIKRRLDFIEKDYIKKKIKLLHVLENIKSAR